MYMTIYCLFFPSDKDVDFGFLMFVCAGMLLEMQFLISFVYVMYISHIARYTFGVLIVFAVFISVNYNVLFEFEGYTKVLAGVIQA